MILINKYTQLSSYMTSMSINDIFLVKQIMLKGLSRIDHKILATDILLYKIKIIGDPQCTVCTKKNETIEHLLLECECVKQLSNETISWLSQHGIHITINDKSFIFGIETDQKNYVNRLVLMEINYFVI